MPTEEKKTSEFIDYIDYQEASSSDEAIYFGSITNPPLQNMLSNIRENGRKSIYFYHVFDPNKRLNKQDFDHFLFIIKSKIEIDDYEIVKSLEESLTKIPEGTLLSESINIINKLLVLTTKYNITIPSTAGKRRYLEKTDLEETWDYEKNKAFWAGAIDKNRQFILLTDFDSYPGYNKKTGNKNKITGTMDEILWLEDNGYNFYPNPANLIQTLCEPPEHPRPEKIIKNYRNGYDDGEDCTVHMLDRIQKIKLKILESRNIQRASLTTTGPLDRFNTDTLTGSSSSTSGFSAPMIESFAKQTQLTLLPKVAESVLLLSPSGGSVAEASSSKPPILEGDKNEEKPAESSGSSVGSRPSSPQA